MRTRPPGSPGHRRPPSGRWHGSWTWTWPAARRSTGRRIVDLKEAQVRLLDELFAVGEPPDAPAADGPADAADLDEITELAE